MTEQVQGGAKLPQNSGATEEQIEAVAGPSEARLAQARDAIDRTFGWKHLRKYGRMSEEWMDKLRDGLARNVLASEEIPAAAVTDDREKLIAELREEARIVREMTERDPDGPGFICRWDPDEDLLDRAADALAAPVEVDEAELSEALSWALQFAETDALVTNQHAENLIAEVAPKMAERLRGKGR